MTSMWYIFFLLFIISLLISACSEQVLFNAPTASAPLSSPKPIVSISDTNPFTAGTLLFDHTGLENGLSQSSVQAPYQNEPIDPGTITPGSVTANFEDNAKIFWSGTTNGLNKFNPDRAPNGLLTHPSMGF